MADTLNVAERLRLAYQPKGNRRYSNPLDVIGLLEDARFSGPDGENAVVPLFLGSPMFFWEIAKWAASLDVASARAAIRATTSPGWRFDDQTLSDDRRMLLAEVSRRLSEIDNQIYPLGDNEVAKGRFNLNRDLPITFIDELWKPNYDGDLERKRVLRSSLSFYREWLVVNQALGVDEKVYVDAMACISTRAFETRLPDGLHGVGRTRIMLERTTSASTTPMGVVTASVLSNVENPAWSPAIVPDISTLGLLRLSDQFMESVAKAWRYHLARDRGASQQILVFSVRPSITQMLEQISGKSAEASILAAIESSASGRALRHDVVASAKTDLDAGVADADPDLNPISNFSSSKMHSAEGTVEKIVLHEKNVDEFSQSRNKELSRRMPKLVPARKHRRDVMRNMEVRSNRSLAFVVPAVVGIVFAVLGIGWQLVKLSYAQIPGTLVDPNQSSPLILPGLLLSELFCGLLCAAVTLQCMQSLRLNLDSGRYVAVCLLTCVTVVCFGTLLPVGVRGEGWLDLPYRSVLFGQPHINAVDVIRAGGLGPLIIHSILQILGYVTIMLGVVAMTIRLRRSRAVTEVVLNDRIQLTKLDYYVCKYLLAAFFLVMLSFGLARNGMWHFYLEQLNGVLLFDRKGSLVEILIPLIAICFTLMVCVSALWAAVTGLFLRQVVDSTPEFTESTTPEGILDALPASARFLTRMGRIVHIGAIEQKDF
ncbi:MAG: hypothetical protein AAF664_16900 [Planctomycetota bacterium]